VADTEVLRSTKQVWQQIMYQAGAHSHHALLARALQWCSISSGNSLSHLSFRGGALLTGQPVTVFSGRHERAARGAEELATTGEFESCLKARLCDWN